MIQSQRILTESYIEKIFDEVSNNIGLERFQSDSFPIDENCLLYTAQVKQPQNLLASMVPTTEGDFRSAVALYEAYKDITPLQAINAHLWESLSLTDLFPYMRDRWGLKQCSDAATLRSGILNHFTVKAHGLMRHGLAGLWWLVHLTVDEDRDNPYELTEIIFKNYTLRTVRFGVGRVIQHKEAAIGILQYIKDHEDEIPSMESLAHGLTSHFNKLGAIKQLTYMDRDFFYSEMEKHFEEFKVATTHYNTED